MATKIALIDFDEGLLESSQAELERRGYKVRTATDGVAGLQLIEQMRPEIVVLELVLPKLHGLQLCARLRKHPELQTKLIVAASPTFAIDIRKAREMGAASFLNKPYAAEDLARAIKSVESVPIPHNEIQRMAALRSYDILDTLPEKSFDDLAQLAAIICETPGAMITFVDSDRLWFKSMVGFVANDVPRELSFCAHAIMHHEVMVVEDAAKDERFAGNPLVSSAPRVRFYAGSPLRTAEGEALGSVCVIGQEPRTISAQQKQALRLLANQVQLLLMTGIAKDFRNGYIGSYTAGVDHDFGDVKLSAAYVATMGIHLASVYSPNSYGGAEPAFAPFTQFDSSGHATGGFGPEILMTSRSARFSLPGTEWTARRCLGTRRGNSRPTGTWF